MFFDGVTIMMFDGQRWTICHTVVPLPHDMWYGDNKNYVAFGKIVPHNTPGAVKTTYVYRHNLPSRLWGGNDCPPPDGQEDKKGVIDDKPLKEDYWHVYAWPSSKEKKMNEDEAKGRVLAGLCHKIIEDEKKLDEFLAVIPDTNENEVYYLCLFCRHKYAPSFPNTRDSGQLARITARNKAEIKEKIRRMECPVGSYSRDGVVAPQDGMALYMSLNPRSLAKANKWLLVEMAKRAADGQMEFNPLTLATTAIHNAGDRKFFVDFDFDDVDPADYRKHIQNALPNPVSYKILKTRGGFHLLVLLEHVKGNKKWYQAVAQLPKCDVRGADTLTPVAGCVQGGFVPHFVEFES